MLQRKTRESGGLAIRLRVMLSYLIEPESRERGDAWRAIAESLRACPVATSGTFIAQHGLSRANLVPLLGIPVG
jgi:hypothetical protein